MVVPYVHGVPYDTVRCHFSKDISELEWIPSDGRRCRDYYVLSEKTKRTRHAFRLTHTNSGLMYPPAMSANNVEKNGGEVVPTTDTPHVTTRDRKKSSATREEQTGEAPQSMIEEPASRVLDENLTEMVGNIVEGVIHVPESMANMLAGSQEALKLIPVLNGQMNCSTLQFERSEERVQKQLISLNDELNELQAEKSEIIVDDIGSIGSNENTLKEFAAAPEPVPPPETGGERKAEGSNEPSPRFEKANDEIGVTSEAVKANSLGPPDDDPGDDDNSDDESKKICQVTRAIVEEEEEDPKVLDLRDYPRWGKRQYSD